MIQWRHERVPSIRRLAFRQAYVSRQHGRRKQAKHPPASLRDRVRIPQDEDFSEDHRELDPVLEIRHSTFSRRAMRRSTT